jgi:uncharacterized cupredoxin-like copper-binding protein
VVPFRPHRGLLLLAGLALAALPATLRAQPDDSGMADMAGMDMGTQPHAKGFSFGAPAPASTADRTVRITLHGFRFDPASLVAHRGEVIHFVIVNPESVAHEFVIGDAAEQRAHEAEMAHMGAMHMTMMHADPNAVDVPPRQSAELTWRFATPGIVAYACHLPGHFAAGMKGEVRVQ